MSTLCGWTPNPELGSTCGGLHLRKIDGQGLKSRSRIDGSVDAKVVIITHDGEEKLESMAFFF